jgi:hypothetical protein
MEEEALTADKRQQLKDDKTKFDKAMASILALEKSASSTGTEDDLDDDAMQVDPETDEVSDLADSYYTHSQMTGEVH